jgi:hypothetical protein
LAQWKSFARKPPGKRLRSFIDEYKVRRVKQPLLAANSLKSKEQCNASQA